MLMVLAMLQQVLLEREILGDGNCGFNAIAVGLLYYFQGLNAQQRRLEVAQLLQVLQPALTSADYANFEKSLHIFFLKKRITVLSDTTFLKNYQIAMAMFLRQITVPVLQSKLETLLTLFFSINDAEPFYFPAPYGGLFKYSQGKLFEYQMMQQGAQFVSVFYDIENQTFVNEATPLSMAVTSEEEELLSHSSELFGYYVDLSDSEVLPIVQKKDVALLGKEYSLSLLDAKAIHESYYERYCNALNYTFKKLGRSGVWATAKTLTICCERLGFVAEFRSAPEEFKTVTDPRAIKFLNAGSAYGEGVHFNVMVNVPALQFKLSERAFVALSREWATLKTKFFELFIKFQDIEKKTLPDTAQERYDEIGVTLTTEGPMLYQFSKTGQGLLNSYSMARLLTTALACQRIVAVEAAATEDSHVLKEHTGP